MYSQLDSIGKDNMERHEVVSFWDTGMENKTKRSFTVTRRSTGRYNKTKQNHDNGPLSSQEKKKNLGSIKFIHKKRTQKFKNTDFYLIN